MRRCCCSRSSCSVDIIASTSLENAAASSSCCSTDALDDRLCAGDDEEEVPATEAEVPVGRSRPGGGHTRPATLLLLPPPPTAPTPPVLPLPASSSWPSASPTVFDLVLAAFAEAFPLAPFLAEPAFLLLRFFMPGVRADGSVPVVRAGRLAVGVAPRGLVACSGVNLLALSGAFFSFGFDGVADAPRLPAATDGIPTENGAAPPI